MRDNGSWRLDLFANEALYQLSYDPNQFGAYYAVFRVKGKLIWKSLKTSDREFAKRKLQEELEKQGRVEPDATNLTLSELLKLYEESLSQFDQKTQATRRSILKKFKESWDHGFEISVKTVTPAQLELWLAKHKARLKKVSLNEYIRFTRQLFALGLKARAIANSPAADFKLLRPETPVRTTPTWKQFLAIVRDIRSQKFSADAQESADLVEFMGKAGVGTAECAGMCGEHIDFQNKRITLYRHKTEKGVDFKTIASWQGHRDGGVLIAKTYSHLRNEHSENMAKKLV